RRPVRPRRAPRRRRPRAAAAHPPRALPERLLGLLPPAPGRDLGDRVGDGGVGAALALGAPRGPRLPALGRGDGGLSLGVTARARASPRRGEGAPDRRVEAPGVDPVAARRARRAPLDLPRDRPARGAA